MDPICIKSEPFNSFLKVKKCLLKLLSLPFINLLHDLWLRHMGHCNRVSLMRPSTNYPKCHLCHRGYNLTTGEWRLLLAGSEPRTWHYWWPTPANTRPALRRGSAAITHGGLMLLMRESPPRRPAPPRGVATQRHHNLSWQTVRHATVTLPCTHSHMHRFIKIHTCAHTQIHKKYPWPHKTFFYTQKDAATHAQKQIAGIQCII